MEPTEPSSDDDFEYRPLVAAGEDRAAILAEVIERWVTEAGAWIDENDHITASEESMRESPASLVGVDLRDDNPGADPIDLGQDLLVPLAERLREEHGEESAKSLAVAVLYDCRVGSFQADRLRAPFGLILAGRQTRVDTTTARRATFGGDARFDGATFGGDAWFNGATFGSAAVFGRATFGGDAWFGGAAFGGPASFDFADLRRARVADTARLLRAFGRIERRARAATDWINWRWARSLGEWSPFTRVSYLALAAVPLLAGLWAPLRQGVRSINGALAETNETLQQTSRVLSEAEATADELIESVAEGDKPPSEAQLNGVIESFRYYCEALDGQVVILSEIARAELPDQMPIGWLMAFCAALAVVVAQAIYQRMAPERLRRDSIEELVRQATEETREHGITDDRLLEALSHLRDAASKLPHRHNQWFVSRPGRTVWIPDRLKHFTPARIEKPKPTGDPGDWEPGQLTDDPNPEVQPEDRKRIAIEEGEKARYEVAAFEERSWALVCGGAYLLALWLIAAVLLRQLYHVAAVSPVPWLGEIPRVLSEPALVGYVSLAIGVLTVLGTLTVRVALPFAESRRT